MRVIFAGTPDFAARALHALIDSRHQVTLVLTQPDRPAGRGKKLQSSPVKRLATEAGIPVDQPRTLRDAAARDRLLAEAADVMVVAAYGLILPREVLEIPARGCVNIHASVLPRWRGAAPIQRAIEAGDPVSGITIMQMDEGLDTGPVLMAESLEIAADETGGSLHDRLARLGARLIVSALDRLEAGDLVAVPQPADGACYAHKIDKSQAEIDWGLPANAIVDHVRAFDPVPGCMTHLAQADEVLTLKIWAARPDPAPGGGAAPGTIVSVADDGVRVACGDGRSVRLTELQRPGGRRLPAAEFLKGMALRPGQRLCSTTPGTAAKDG
ncbi:MAG: methionyl-tRNA formyltransferase [Burkholderiaceae bacterium]